MEPLGDVECAQVMLHVTDDLQAEVMAEYNEGAFSLNCGVKRFHRKFAVVAVRDLLSRRSNLNNY